MSKRPAFQFYPGDWMKDPALRACSPAARGIWIDMLCLAFESPRRGYLEFANGSAITDEQIVRMTGANAKLLSELESSGVFSREPTGTIYSRRMVRDEAVRSARAAGGILGGNPTLMKDTSKVDDKVNLPANHASTIGLTPSSSSSSSSSEEDNKDFRKGFTTEQKAVVDRAEGLLGQEWPNDRSKWLMRIERSPKKVERVMANLKVEMELGKVKRSPAGWAETLWKKMGTDAT